MKKPHDRPTHRRGSARAALLALALGLSMSSLGAALLTQWAGPTAVDCWTQGMRHLGTHVLEMLDDDAPRTLSATDCAPSPKRSA